MNVNIRTIPHEQQRYNTIGDWWWEGDVLEIRVSSIGNWKAEMTVAFHELHEALECNAKGITQEMVDAFDKEFLREGGDNEPGDDPSAPYYWQHQHASVAEHHLANCLELSWAEYEAEIIRISCGL